MGTHNLLMRIGDQVYLELIAIDPEAPTPGRPRCRFALKAIELEIGCALTLRWRSSVTLR